MRSLTLVGVADKPKDLDIEPSTFVYISPPNRGSAHHIHQEELQDAGTAGRGDCIWLVAGWSLWSLFNATGLSNEGPIRQVCWPLSNLDPFLLVYSRHFTCWASAMALEKIGIYLSRNIFTPWKSLLPGDPRHLSSPDFSP